MPQSECAGRLERARQAPARTGTQHWACHSEKGGRRQQTQWDREGRVGKVGTSSNPGQPGPPRSLCGETIAKSVAAPGRCTGLGGREGGSRRRQASARVGRVTRTACDVEDENKKSARFTKTRTVQGSQDSSRTSSCQHRKRRFKGATYLKSNFLCAAIAATSQHVTPPYLCTSSLTA